MTTTSSARPLISADSHVTEPIELYAERMDRRFRDRAPRIHNTGGWRVLEAEGMAVRKLMTASELDLAIVGGSDPDQRYREQEQDGVVAEVVFPNWALQVCFVPEDPELQLALTRAYNDWAAETLLGHDRILPVGLLPMLDIGAAVTEARRLAGLGFRALFLPARVPSRPYNDEAYDPFWAAAEEIGLPLTFHSGTGYDPRIVRGPGGAVINYLLGAQSDGPSVFLHLAAGGALDRFPGLRIVTVETGAAWIAWVLTQSDLVYEDHKMFRKTSLSLKPSELIRRQCHATFMSDPVAVHNRSITGVECLLWGNDYPHPEGTWPHSAAAVEEQFAGVPADEVLAMVAGNSARVFGFDLASLPAVRRPVTDDVGVTRGGPKAPVDTTPPRPAGSVRRTSTIDSARPDGIEGDVQVLARARDLHTTRGGDARVLATAGFDASIAADRTLRRIDHPDERLSALVGLAVAGGFRGRAVALVPDEAEHLTLLNLLLDDLPGANLVAGYAMQHDPSWTQRRIPVEHLGAAVDLCAGWARGATILEAVEANGTVPTPTAAPVALADDDPVGWHERAALPPGAMRRARRLDLVPDGDEVRFDVHFRDSYVDERGVEGAVHEYSVWGRFDPSIHTIVELDAAAHVLPWVECPQALGSATRLVGATVDELRAVVRADFVGTSTCTHLNDTLRGLADLPALAAMAGF